jgi:hypothetical protein
MICLQLFFENMSASIIVHQSVVVNVGIILLFWIVTLKF